jgi:hypothetical protein
MQETVQNNDSQDLPRLLRRWADEVEKKVAVHDDATDVTVVDAPKQDVDYVFLRGIMITHQTEAIWVKIEGLPDNEGRDATTTDKSGVMDLEGMKSACEKDQSCVGFAYCPSTRQWYPKRVGTGFTPSSARYSQKWGSQIWEWHYIDQRARENDLHGNMDTPHRAGEDSSRQDMAEVALLQVLMASRRETCIWASPHEVMTFIKSTFGRVPQEVRPKSLFESAICKLSAGIDTSVLGVETEIGSMNMVPREGRVEIRDLIIDNPEGYQSPFLLRAKRVLIDIDMQKLQSSSGTEVDVVETVFEGVDVNFEGVRSKSNLSDILDRISSARHGRRMCALYGDNEGKDDIALILHKVSAKDTHVKFAAFSSNCCRTNCEVADITYDNFDKEVGDSGRSPMGIVSTLAATFIRSLFCHAPWEACPRSLLGSLLSNLSASFDSAALGVEARIGSMKLLPTQGRAEIQGLVVDNPEGYHSPYSIHVNRVTLDIDMQKLLLSRGGEANIEQIMFEGVNVNYESALSTSNLDDLLGCIESAMCARDRRRSLDATARKEGVTLSLHKLSARDVSLTVFSTRCASTNFAISDITYEDFDTGIGSDHSFTAVVSILMMALIHNIFDQTPRQE